MVVQSTQDHFWLQDDCTGRMIGISFSANSRSFGNLWATLGLHAERCQYVCSVFMEKSREGHCVLLGLETGSHSVPRERNCGAAWGSHERVVRCEWADGFRWAAYIGQVFFLSPSMRCRGFRCSAPDTDHLSISKAICILALMSCNIMHKWRW